MTNETRPMTLPEMVEYARRRHGEALAYAQGGRRETWASLVPRIEQAAAGLVALGLEKGDRVAICAENGIDWIVGYLATARAGATGVLVYFELKPREIEEQVQRPGCRLLFASPDVMKKLGGRPGGVEHVVLLGAPEDVAAGPHLRFESLGAAVDETAATELASRTPTPDDIAVIVYTSGTTGGAKGVMLSHRNVVSNALAAMEALEVTAKDSSLLVLPMHHAMPFMAAVLLPALSGGHFIIENELPRIRDRLQEHRPTIFFGVPALYELMYRNVMARAEAEGRLRTLQSWQKRLGRIKRLTGVNLAPLLFRSVHKALGGRLRFLVSGGAALNPQTVHDFSGLGLPLLQGWGMTEASPVIAVQRFSPRRFRYTNYYEKHAGSVGPALPGVEVRLVDVPEKGITVAEHGEGEVLVRGDNVFAGYWQAEAETAAVKQDGWLRTGDMARIDKQGNIYLTGRSKYIIVLESGEKVHPDELEETLSQSPLLHDVCVVGRKQRDRTQVTAVVYPNAEDFRARYEAAGASFDDVTLRRLVQQDVEQLCRQLAAYKRVTNVELTDQPLPKTPLQKVARGHVAEQHEFDFTRWLASSEEQR